jgi:hypothetical protein
VGRGSAGEEPAIASTALKITTDEIAAREASLQRAEMPADAMDRETWEGQRTKEAASLRLQRELVAEAAGVIADRADVAAAAAADAAMLTHFRALAPPAPQPPQAAKNGEGRRADAPASGGGPASGDARSPPRGAADAAASAVGRKGGKGGGKGGPPGGGKGRRDDPPRGPPAGKGGGHDDYEHDRGTGGAPQGAPRDAKEYPIACFERDCTFRC